MKAPTHASVLWGADQGQSGVRLRGRGTASIVNTLNTTNANFHKVIYRTRSDEL